MSRGPGKWQRAILEALERSEVVALCDLLPDLKDRHFASVYEFLCASCADITALERAARRLAEAGRCKLCNARRWQLKATTTHLVAYRTDTDRPLGMAPSSSRRLAYPRMTSEDIFGDRELSVAGRRATLRVSPEKLPTLTEAVSP